MTEPEIEALGKQWHKIADTKWNEFRANYIDRIWVYSPQNTITGEIRNNEKASMDLLAWSVKWFREKGLKAVISIGDDKLTVIVNYAG